MLTYPMVFYCVNEGKPMKAGDSITSKDEKPANMLLEIQWNIKPSKKSIDKVTEKISNIIKKGKAWPQEVLIDSLNPIITGWSNYHLATRNYITNCRNATPSTRSDLIMACVFSNEIV